MNSHEQNIFQSQPKHTKDRQSHGGVRPDKYAKSRVHNASPQPVTLSDPSRTSQSNTKVSRPQKRSTKRRLSQLATWVEDPIVFKVRQLARDKNLSQSKALRRIVIQGLAEDGDLESALDMESLRESLGRDYRRLAKQLLRFLVWLLYDAGQLKALQMNTLGLQKGMTEAMLKDIVQDADRQTRGRLSRMEPDLADFIDGVVEKWLRSEEENRSQGRPSPNGERGRGIA
jgi:hypothetical protein